VIWFWWLLLGVGYFSYWIWFMCGVVGETIGSHPKNYSQKRIV
jgi:hypothetical protein